MTWLEVWDVFTRTFIGPVIGVAIAFILAAYRYWRSADNMVWWVEAIHLALIAAVIGSSAKAMGQSWEGIARTLVVSISVGLGLNSHAVFPSYAKKRPGDGKGPVPTVDTMATVGHSAAMDQDAKNGSSETAEEKIPDTERAPVLPLAAWVRGGTPTSGSERLYEERFREAEVRRDQAAADKRIGTTPIEQGGGRMHVNKFTANPEIPQAYVLLHYVTESGAKMPPGECCADIYMEDWNRADNWTLGIMCPMCWSAGVKHAQDCQIRIQQQNRPWTLLPGKGPANFFFNDGTGPKMYPSAGIIVESEVFHCPDCSWTARIVNNHIRTER